MVNLKGTKGLIISVRSRDRTGRNIHKHEFSIDDKKAIDNELRTWKDKLGVPLKTFQDIVNNPLKVSELEEVRNLVKQRMNENKSKLKKAFSKRA